MTRDVIVLSQQEPRQSDIAPSRWPRLIVMFAPLLGVFACLGLSAPALAAPQLAIEMTHANAYGLQASDCPSGREESFPNEPERGCGVDPFTGSGTTFTRESGFNTYTITVKNVAQRSAGPGPGSTLSCETGSWEEGPTFSYSWLRNGEPIAGAESAEYTLSYADEGDSVQCLVTASNASGATAQATNAVDVVPVSTTASPALEEGFTVHIPGESTTFAPGQTLECEHGAWTGHPTFSYRWLHNGLAIAGAVENSYTLTASDLGTAVQCQVIAANAGGVVVADNPFPSPVGTTPEPFPPFYNSGPAIPVSGALSNETAGAVTVADQLPAGLEAIAAASEPAASGSNWACTTTSVGRGVSCTNTQSLSPGSSYAPISLHVHVTGEAPTGAPPAGGATNTVAVSGGGSASAFASDATEVRPAVPFGIESFTTSVTDSLGAPLTQAAAHPFAATAAIVFNHTPETGGKLMTAGGSPDDVETELPPGFAGDPQDAATCTAAQLDSGHQPGENCPGASAIGFTTAILSYAGLEGGKVRPFSGASSNTFVVYNLAPAPGDASSFGFVDEGSFFALNARVRSDGDYGLTIGDMHAGRRPNGVHGLTAVRLTICGYGVTGHGSVGGGTPATVACAAPTAGVRPFLTTPSSCAGPAPVTTVIADTYEDPAAYVSKTVFNGAHLTGDAASLAESFGTGCNALRFAPTIEFLPASGAEGGTSEADEPTGAEFNLKIPQAAEEAALRATPELKDATVTLPEGMTANPATADGLRGCSDAQFGLGSTVEPAEPAQCPLASQIGTVEICTPLLANQTGNAEDGEQSDRECEEGKTAPVLQGQVFIGEPECSPCSATEAEEGRLLRLFLQVRAPERGVIVKLAGKVHANALTGRLQATFAEQPQLPFGELRLKLEGGPRAPLATPQNCGPAQTSALLTPWSAPGPGGLSGSEPVAGTPNAAPSSSVNIDWDGAGGACPATLPFAPSFTAGTQSAAAGGSSPLSVTFGRQDREQNLSGLTVRMPEGLLGRASEVSNCPDAQSAAGTCPASSQIGTATVAAGAGPDPYYLSGALYLTGPYKGEPFGLSVAVPAEAGPFKLAGNTGDGLEVVRAAIAVDPNTAALTIASDPLPQVLDGVPLRLRQVNADVNRSGFIVNPTSCAPLRIGATLTGSQGASAAVSSPFGVTGCSSLPFHPSLVARTPGARSKANGAGLVVTVTSAPGEANIGKVDLALPKALPTRLTTLHKACPESQFNTNPAGCPEGSNIGTATAHTPLLSNALSGPVYLVSRGGAALPDAEFVLQGENGLEIVIDAQTQIKKGITYSRFETVPDAPITSFETTLLQGPHSILTAPGGNLCGKRLMMPTTITAQSGKQIVQSTKVAVTGCKAVTLTRARLLTHALGACHAKDKGKSREARRRRAVCETLARRRYGPRHTKRARKSASGKGRKQR